MEIMRMCFKFFPKYFLSSAFKEKIFAGGKQTQVREEFIFPIFLLIKKRI